MLVAQGVFCRRPSFLAGYFCLLEETENYVETNKICTGHFLRAEMQVLSVQEETNEFGVQNYQQ